MPQVESSAILRVGYDAAKRELRVTFTSGRTYVYFGVPPDLCDRFLQSNSKGTFFNAHVRDHFAYRERAH